MAKIGAVRECAVSSQIFNCLVHPSRLVPPTIFATSVTVTDRIIELEKRLLVISKASARPDRKTTGALSAHDISENLTGELSAE